MNIAIRGTGKFGKYVYNEIKNNNQIRVKYFVDSNCSVWGDTIEGIPIISPADLEFKAADELDYVLVAFVNSIEKFKDIVVTDKYKYGFIRNRVLDAKLHIDADLRSNHNIIWSDAEYLKKPILRSLETNVVDNCNLNCKGCSHFSNLFKCGDEIPFETFCKDLKQISEHLYINNLYLLGGEVLLNSRIVDYIRYARQVLPYSDIELVSNGLLIPRQKPEFFECCVENDVMISMSGYKPTLLLEKQIRDTLEKYHVIYAFREEVKEFGKNIDLSGKEDKHQAVQRCRESRCHFLRNGKIYKCPFQALGNVFFEHYNIDIRFDGGTDIYKNNLNWEELVDSLHNAPIDACRYCGKEERMEWQVSNNPSVSDWIIKSGE